MEKSQKCVDTVENTMIIMINENLGNEVSDMEYVMAAILRRG